MARRQVCAHVGKAWHGAPHFQGAAGTQELQTDMGKKADVGLLVGFTRHMLWALRGHAIASAEAERTGALQSTDAQPVCHL